MKKIFLAAVTALALCSYSYAQDDEYEEDSPRAAATSESSTSSSSIKSGSGDAFMGMSLDLLGFLNHDLKRFALIFKLSEQLELDVHLGLLITGDIEGEDGHGDKVDGDEGGGAFALGAGVDYFLPVGVLPLSLGGDIIFTHNREDDNELDFDVMLGLRAEIVKNFSINGKVGFDLNYHWWTAGDVDWDRLNFGLATRIDFIWFFL